MGRKDQATNPLTCLTKVFVVWWAKSPQAMFKFIDIEEVHAWAGEVVGWLN